MLNPTPVVKADLRRSRLGVLAVILLVALAVAIGVAVSAQERALRTGSADAAEKFDLVIGAPGSETQLILSSVYLQPASLDLIDGVIIADLAEGVAVQYVAPLGFGDSFEGRPIIGTTAEFVTAGGSEPLVEGEMFQTIDEAVVGADVDLAVGASFVPIHGQVVLEEEEHGHTGISYTIVGRMARQGNPWDRAIIVPIEAVWWIHGLPTGHAENEAILAELAMAEALHEAAAAPGAAEDGHAGEHAAALDQLKIGPPWDRDHMPGVPAILVRPASFADAYALRAEYRSDRTMAVFPAEVLTQLYAVLGDVRDLLASVSVLTQILVIGAVMLAVLATLAQRRRMMAVLRALGASRGYLLLAVWLSVSLMIAVGALLGLAIGWAGAFGLSRYLAAETGVALPVTLTGQELGLVATLIGIGIVIAAVPALLAYRQPVSTALRG